MAKKKKEAPQKEWDAPVMIPVDKLVFCDWNVNEMDDQEFAALCEEIKTNGFDEPCQVVPQEDGNYLVLGGEHRTKASKSLGFTEIPCVIKKTLAGAPERDLVLWSVLRNNIRGKINAQKYAKLEQRLAEKWSVAAEAARREMLIKGDLLRSLRKFPELEKNDELSLTDDDISDGPSVEKKKSESAGSGGEGKDGYASRRALLMALRAAEQDVLLQSKDTLVLGYLFFAQNGGLHLIINEDEELKESVGEMVKLCKNNSDSVLDFIKTAINKELPNWR